MIMVFFRKRCTTWLLDYVVVVVEYVSIPRKLGLIQNLNGNK